MQRTGTVCRRSWRLDFAGKDWLIVLACDVPEGQEEVRNPPWLGARLRRGLAETFTQRTLLDLCAELWGTMGRSRQDLHWLCARLEEEFRRGRLVLVRPGQPIAEGKESSGGGTPAGAQKKKDEDDAAPRNTGGAPQRRRALTWVAIRLVGPDNLPVANERYRVVLADGSVADGQLDSSGEAWLEDVTPGDCQISFPNLDAREWSA
jgi:hypothetical protein